MKKAAGYNTEYIKNLIDKYEYISFDLFDTLIKRNINHPHDLFDLVEYEYNKKHERKISNFRDMRIEAEHKACELKNEPNLDEIYEALGIKDKEELKRLEIELELEICQQNIDFYPIYEYAKREGKKIVIISDMYLPKNTVLQILKDAQIDFDYFFLSNEVGLNKRKGAIYPYVLKKLGMRSSEIIHIGDSKRNDFLTPRFYGIKSVLIPKKIHKLNYYANFRPRTLDENILLNFLNNNLSLEKNYYRVGYETLGPILYGYAKWIDEEINMKNIENVYFLAREGKILMNAYKIFCPDSDNVKYLYVSRQSTRPCLLARVESLEQFYKICIVRKGATLEDFFKYAGLDIGKYHDLLTQYHMKKDDLVWSAPCMKNLFSELKDDIQSSAMEKENLLTAYLKQGKIKGKIAVSDIGWHGTMQKSLQSWVRQNNIDASLYGLYIANFGENSSSSKQYGYLYNERLEEYRVKGFIGLFENLFLAEHGTTTGYAEEKHQTVPILAKYEYSEHDDKIYREVQKGALDFVQQIGRLKDLNLSVAPDFARFGIEKLGLEPSRTDLREFGKMLFMDTRKLKMIYLRYNLLGYLLHPKEMKRDFLDSSWKIGWLKSLFKLPLPYVKILQVLYKML